MRPWLTTRSRPAHAAGAVLATALALASGCALQPPAPAAAGLAGCRGFYADLDARVDAAGVRDAQARPVPGRPWLRVDRFLASYREPPRAGAARAAWIDALAALDTAARRLELRNVPWNPAADAARLEDCAARLRAADGTAADLAARAAVPDDYRPLQRLLGLYPVTARGVMRGVARLHRESATVFAIPLADLPRAGTLTTWAPGEPAALAPPGIAALVEASRDALGVPRPAAADTRRLFTALAPIFVVDVAGDADRPGAPRWQASGVPGVDPARPTVYTLVSHARLGADVLLQLNYVIWFGERPRSGPLDLLGGRLDGLTVRATLARDGGVLAWETMHNCGCYHMTFPGPGLARRDDPDPGTEPLWVPQPAPPLAPGERLAVHLASGTHYVQRLTASGLPGATHYRLVDYDRLRSLPLPGGGRRSLFDPAGLVPGTQRLERWVLWPMGIASPGAMRQWGRHATAFVGRRHFDDPHLLERYWGEAD